MRLFSFFLIFISACASFQARSAEIKIATIDYAPFGYHDGLKAEGVGVDIIREIARRMGDTTTDVLIPTTRMIEMSQKHISLFPTVTKTPERENQYRWVGKMVDDHYCFVIHKGEAPIQTLDEAKKLKAVAVNRGGNTEAFLLKNKFTNLDFATGNAGSIRKLNANLVPAWFSSDYSARFSMKEAGLNPENFPCTGNFSQPAYWIAASEMMPEAQFNKVKSVYAEMEKDGTIAKILAKLK